MLDEDFALAPFQRVIAYLHRELGLSPPTFGQAADEDPDDPGDDNPDDGVEPEATAGPPPQPPPEPYFRYSSG